MSFVEEAIRILSNNHALDLEDGVDHPKKVRGHCRLASGIETTFVSAFCDNLRASINPHIPFNQFFYIPSRPAESLVGYDLSIGDYRTQARARTMHKVVYETWCDKDWGWSLGYELNNRNEPRGDYSHIITLLQNYQNHPDLVPYLVLHVCYCIHDYRRMGIGYADFQLPSFDSLLRTVVISLPALFVQVDDWNRISDQEDFRFTIRKQSPVREENESPQDYLDRLSQKDQFTVEIQPGNSQLENCILTLDEFCAEISHLENRNG